MLTLQQSRLLRFIEDKLRARGISPSFEEMRLHLGLGSKSGVHRLLEGLSERGFIERLRNRARALRVIRGSDAARCVRATEGSSDEAISADASISLKVSYKSSHKSSRKSSHKVFPKDSPKVSPAPSFSPSVVRVPFLGRVAAGLPIESLGFVDEERDCPSELLGTREGRGAVGVAPHYALRVEGDSMIEAGILDGDTIIVESIDTARDGELVIALVDDGEATLKILRLSGEEIVLEAANSCYAPQRFSADRVRVQGRVTGLLRSYPRV